MLVSACAEKFISLRFLDGKPLGHDSERTNKAYKLYHCGKFDIRFMTPYKWDKLIFLVDKILLQFITY